MVEIPATVRCIVIESSGESVKKDLPLAEFNALRKKIEKSGGPPRLWVWKDVV